MFQLLSTSIHFPSQVYIKYSLLLVSLKVMRYWKSCGATSGGFVNDGSWRGCVWFRIDGRENHLLLASWLACVVNRKSPATWSDHVTFVNAPSFLCERTKSCFSRRRGKVWCGASCWELLTALFYGIASTVKVRTDDVAECLCYCKSPKIGKS
jgi:hypothetical protein